MRKYWLMKSEPETYPIEKFKKDGVTVWDGVRNYQARNFMKEMKEGDVFVFYHSNAEPPAAVGLGRVCGPAKPDRFQFDKKSEFFDSKAKKDSPTWWGAHVEYLVTFKRPVSLTELRAEKQLSKMVLLQKGSRLSVQPVTAGEMITVCRLGGVELPT